MKFWRRDDFLNVCMFVQHSTSGIQLYKCAMIKNAGIGVEMELRKRKIRIEFRFSDLIFERVIFFELQNQIPSDEIFYRKKCRKCILKIDAIYHGFFLPKNLEFRCDK